MPVSKENLPIGNQDELTKRLSGGFHNVSSPRVVALVYDGLCTFEFGIVCEVFGLARPEFKQGWYDFHSVALEKAPLRAAGGLEFSASGTQADFERADTILIPGWRGVLEPVPKELITAIQHAYQRGTRIVSICSGLYVLAAAGLLEGRRVTTHWRYLQDFAKRYPNVILEPNSLYVDEGQILTSAGSSAGIDLCLHIVRQDYGMKIANSVARRLVMHAHRQGGQSQFIEQPIPKKTEAHRLSATLDYIKTNLNQPHDVASLAQYSGMSRRSFQRKFTALTGLSVGRWINQLRLTHACNLLETTNANMDEIADAAGISNGEGLRYHFRKDFGVSPGEYRKRFARL